MTLSSQLMSYDLEYLSHVWDTAGGGSSAGLVG